MFMSYCCFLVEKAEKEKKKISFLSLWSLFIKKKRKNVRCVALQKCIWCKNAFGAKMHLVQKCIWCKNAFGAKMHLVQKCIWCKNAFGAKMHFCNATQCTHFVEQNVQPSKCKANAQTQASIFYLSFICYQFNCIFHAFRGVSPSLFSAFSI